MRVLRILRILVSPELLFLLWFSKHKMRQTYILFRPPRDDDSETKESESNSNAVFELGEHIHRGYVDYGMFTFFFSSKTRKN